MAQVESAKEQVMATGAQWIFIAAEKQQGVWNPKKFLQQHPLSFPFLLDEDRSVTKAYGVYHRIGVDAIHIAHPATLVVAQDGTAQFVYRGDNQLDRATLADVLQAAAKLVLPQSQSTLRIGL